MRGKGPADETDLVAQLDDPPEHVVALPSIERALVELVDLAFDLFHDQEVPVEDLLDEGRQEVARRQYAELRLAFEPLPVPLQRPRLARMDADHDVLTGDEVDLAADQRAVVRPLALDGFDGEVDAILGACQARAPGIGVISAQLLDTK